jgi:hypothetical protein
MTCSGGQERGRVTLRDVYVLQHSRRGRPRRAPFWYDSDGLPEGGGEGRHEEPGAQERRMKE